MSFSRQLTLNCDSKSAFNLIPGCVTSNVFYTVCAKSYVSCWYAEPIKFSHSNVVAKTLHGEQVKLFIAKHNCCSFKIYLYLIVIFIEEKCKLGA